MFDKRYLLSSRDYFPFSQEGADGLQRHGIFQHMFPYFGLSSALAREGLVVFGGGQQSIGLSAVAHVFRRGAARLCWIRRAFCCPRCRAWPTSRECPCSGNLL